MKQMKIYILLLGLMQAMCLSAQEAPIAYRRSSVYSILLKHSEQKFGEAIADAFTDMPVPDMFNDHDLSVKVIAVPGKQFVSQELIEKFLEKNQVAGRMVAKWFDWDFLTGQCGLKLIKKRGLYDASEMDKALAAKSFRGSAMLEDAGEELISNTFVLVNDIKYNLGSIFNGGLLGGVTGMAELRGFKVKITTYLYQLAWDENVAYDFYDNYFTWTPDEARRDAFKAARGKFKLKYIGCQESSGKSTSSTGLGTPHQMLKKACQRALDENIASLQTNFEVFQIKVPLLSAKPITAPVGRKEGVNAESEFEVLEKRIDKKGKTIYKRAGVIIPVEEQIWDNRYMAVEEKAYNADLKYTTFKKKSGGKFAPGMLIRQIK